VVSLTTTLPAGSWGVAVQTYDDGSGSYGTGFTLTVTLGSAGTGGGTGTTGGGTGTTGGGTGGGVPTSWTCSAGFYGAGDGCDCGCGAMDPDCSSGAASACLYCNDTGSCSTVSGCPGNINSTQNWLCN
jgi:hypothetical protein